jgi:hypothetical protein
MADLNSVGFSDPDLETLRIRLRKMNDQELRRFGLAARFMCLPGANLGKPRQVFVIQLEEARAEVQRRNLEKERKRSGPLGRLTKGDKMRSFVWLGLGVLLFLAWAISYIVFHVAGVLIHLLLIFALISFMISEFYKFLRKHGIE